MIPVLLTLLSTTLSSPAQDPAVPPSVSAPYSTPLIPLFTPPMGWQYSRPKNLSHCMQVGFIGKGSTQFHPSISLATEEVDVSLKEYVKAVKEIHLLEPRTAWRDLGKFSMKAGVGRLTEVSSPSPWGEVKTFQAIYVQGKMAYILTAALLKKDVPQLQEEVFQSLRSFTLQPDLSAPISDEKARTRFLEFFSKLGQFPESEKRDERQKEQWEQLQKIVIEELPGMGSYWHFLALKEGYAKIYPSTH